MNKGLVREVGQLPGTIVEMFARECGVEWADPASLMELQAIIIEEIIDKDINAGSVFSAFKDVQESVARRWVKWLQDSVSDALDV